MELRHLRYFVVLAEELHFGKAAARLHIAQPPLSQQIRGLEDELGVQLFQRTKRRVQLTEVGQAFLDEAQRTLAQADAAVRTAQRAQRGEIGQLRIGFVGSAAYAVLPSLLKAFRQQFPDVEIALHQLTTAEQLDALRTQQIHIALLRPPIQDEDIAVRTILQEPLLVALPDNHTLTALDTIPLQMLAHEAFILPPRRLGRGTYDQIISLCQQAGFSPNIVLEAVEMQTIAGLVAAGLGVSLVPASVQYLRSAGIVYRPIAGPTPIWELALAWRHNYQSPVLHRFLEAAHTATEQASYILL